VGREAGKTRGLDRVLRYAVLEELDAGVAELNLGGGVRPGPGHRLCMAAEGNESGCQGEDRGDEGSEQEGERPAGHSHQSHGDARDNGGATAGADGGAARDSRRVSLVGEGGTEGLVVGVDAIRDAPGAATV